MYHIPKKIQVFRAQGTSTALPHALIYPKAVSKRREQQLALHYDPPDLLDNVPTYGFYIRGPALPASRVSDAWAVIDPRGFSMHVSSRSLSMILESSYILNGVIDRPCVWVKHGKSPSMTLTPVGSDLYKIADENTRLLDAAQGISDIKIGDVISTQNGDVGEYMGRHVLSTGLMYNGPKLMRPTAAAYHLFKTSTGIYFTSRPALLTRAAGVQRTPAQAQTWVQTEIVSGTPFYNVSCPGASALMYLSTPMRSVLRKKPAEVKMRLSGITRQEADTLIALSYQRADPGQVVMKTGAGQYYILDLCHRYNFKTIASQYDSNDVTFDIIEIKVNDAAAEFTEFELLGHTNGYFRPNPTNTTDDFQEFFAVVKHVPGGTYI